MCIHGAPGSAAQLDLLVEALRHQGPSVQDKYSIELPGHGATPSEGDDFDIARFSAHVREFILARALDAPILFGYSMGGYVALHLACEAPGLLGGVITLGTKLAWSPEVAVKEAGRLDPATIRAKVPKFAEALETRHREAGGWESVL